MTTQPQTSVPVWKQMLQLRVSLQKEYQMYQVFNKDGSYVTQYANRSEAETYWRSSAGGPVDFDDAEDDSGIVYVIDSHGNGIGEIRGPKPRSAQKADPGNTSERQE